MKQLLVGDRLRDADDVAGAITAVRGEAPRRVVTVRFDDGISDDLDECDLTWDAMDNCWSVYYGG